MLEEGIAYLSEPLGESIAEYLTKITGDKYNEGNRVIFCEFGDKCIYGIDKPIEDSIRKENTITIVFPCILGKKKDDRLEEHVIVNN